MEMKRSLGIALGVSLGVLVLGGLVLFWFGIDIKVSLVYVVVLLSLRFDGMYEWEVGWLSVSQARRPIHWHVCVKSSVVVFTHWVL
jgi:hypothetical protein